jgi:hypothetical protein
MNPKPERSARYPGCVLLGACIRFVYSWKCAGFSRRRADRCRHARVRSENRCINLIPRQLPIDNPELNGIMVLE